MIHQEHFSLLRGHVGQGQEVKLNDGSVATIRSAMGGWAIECNGKVVVTSLDRQQVERWIVNYGERVA